MQRHDTRMQKLSDVRFWDYVEVGNGRNIKTYSVNNPEHDKIEAHITPAGHEVVLTSAHDGSKRHIPIHYVTCYSTTESVGVNAGVGADKRPTRSNTAKK